MRQKLQSTFSLSHRLLRMLWAIAWTILGRPLPRNCFGWRRLLLLCFGARIDPTARVYGTAKIWAPWNLIMGPRSVMADHVDCYNVAVVTLEEGAIVSQYAYLCTAGHAVHDPAFPLVVGPIILRRLSWVGAKAVIGMNVTINEGAVVGLGAVVVKSVPPWTIVGGNPAREIGRRSV